MEFEVRVVRGIENCFVSLPLPLIQTLQTGGRLPPILAVELRSDSRLWHVAWCGSASSSSSSIEIAPHYADCIGLSDHTVVKVRLISNLPKAKIVAIEPLTEDDWEILELNSELAESVILKQVGIVHEGMRFPLWLHGQTVVMFLVVSTSPQEPVVQLVPDIEVVVAPKSRKKSPEESCTIAKAQLRVQDLDSRYTYTCKENGVDMDVLFTSSVLIHPETANKYSFSSGQFVVISSLVPSKGNKKKLQPKSTAADREANTGSVRFKQDGEHAVRLLLSGSVAKGHIMLSQSLRYHFGARLHSWVQVRSCNINLKKDIPPLSISPYHFKMIQNDENAENGPEEVSNQTSLKQRDKLPRINLNAEMGISNWSMHEKIIEALSSESFPDGTEGTAGGDHTRIGNTDGLAALIRTWFIAQLHTVISNSPEDVSSVIIGSKALLHIKVKNHKLRRQGRLLASSNNFLPVRNQAEKPSFDALYILSLSEESLNDKYSNAYELSFDKSADGKFTSTSLDMLLRKLEVIDLCFSNATSESPIDNALDASTSSLDWMGAAPFDVNYSRIDCFIISFFCNVVQQL